MLRDLPAETIYSEIGRVTAQLAEEVERLVRATYGPAPDAPPEPQPEEAAAAPASHRVIGAVRSAGAGQGRGPQTRAPTVSVPESESLRAFFEQTVAPFLRRGAADSPHSASTCGKCHPAEAQEEGVAPKQIKAPAVPDIWFRHARFDHAAHRAVKCQECHEGVKDSKVSADVLLPGIAKCVRCHAPPDRSGGGPGLTARRATATTTGPIPSTGSAPGRAG